MGRTLSELGLAGPETSVTGLAVDNRRVRPGDLFAALPGSTVHGARFAADAVARGAAAVLTDPAGAAQLDLAVPVVTVEDPRAALAFAAALMAGAQPETMVAVTGTNGKTSVASFARQLWEALGHRAANIGTTGVEGAYAAPAAHTRSSGGSIAATNAANAASGAVNQQSSAAQRSGECTRAVCALPRAYWS